MENVILVILLILALGLIGVVLLQRSEGGGLGIGGGGGGVMTGRSAASALAKLTWIFGTGFFICSIALTIISAKNSGDASVLDRLGDAPAVEETAPAATLPGAEDGGLLPPSATDAPLTPPRAD